MQSATDSDSSFSKAKKIDIRQIKKSAKQDFEKTWTESSKLLPHDTEINLKGKKGEEHPFGRMVNKLRNALLETGFDETENFTILPEEDVYKQYGPEAAVILDRAFYLAKLPRPDIGVSKEKTAQVGKIIGESKIEKLKEIFRLYKKGGIESDNLTEELMNRLGIKIGQADFIISLFPEFKNLKPAPSALTLRSHMTAVWYHTLAALQKKRDFPIALFSIGPRYRNEQKEDAGHLRVHNSASLVVMDGSMSLEAGRKIVKEFLSKIGFANVKFIKKKATSRYYAADSEEEIFVEHNGRMVEIGDMGMYSLVSLANFDIQYPVFNAGFGVERLAMILENCNDVRELMFPQFYEREEFSDSEIAGSVFIASKPKTAAGREMAEAIYEVSKKNKDETAPFEVVAWKGEIGGRFAEVKIVEVEEGKKLIAGAGFNKIMVKDGNIKGVAKEEGVDAKVDYMAGIANEIAFRAESGGAGFQYKIRMARSLADINLEIPKAVRNFIKKHHKKIDIRGPVFLTANVETRR
ncbi:MAG: O-phosphoserine--tRNA ligase [Nanoarchaeota archaeon]|nr:O-phosphoserine--tRNA ligase [Nanoarchaeota archaeon]